jgi:hypothetical protein
VLRSYGWSNLHAFVTNAELEVKLLSEIGERGFHEIWNEYGASTLDHALTNGILATDFLRQRFELDLASGSVLRGVPLLVSLKTYGGFVVKRLAVPRPFIKKAVREDPIFKALRFGDLISAGMQPTAYRVCASIAEWCVVAFRWYRTVSRVVH